MDLNYLDLLIHLATELKKEKIKRIEAERKIKSDVPKVLLADAISRSQRSCLIPELAKILQHNGVNIDAERLLAWMRKNNYLHEEEEYFNQPTKKSMDLGLFEVKSTIINKMDGTLLETIVIKVTGKGQVYFVNKFLGNKEAC